ncbi:outer membrane receptor protein involved in Fe transport [Paucibacter oligotrophus]|uniref:Outer membrane receptor protein involved in Fe transport n=1 Tax=Roseateles oligotrophus TaxID=1769250 RepID=A0A840LAS1_9BURK|nr:TonB-dependent receptor [Roseateles oligotrophus]MBB4843813.1 outer membrane receptor protein involved in Fe transport [Roseateles oligotrophus]
MFHHKQNLRPALLAWAALAAGQALAQEAAETLTPQQLPPVQLSFSRGLLGEAQSASEGRINAAQLALRPLLRPAEVLEAVPGLIVTQHSGDGKANQYFLRGFNLDHGSDFSTQLLGMPVNQLSHAHGQGYTDLNFLIPELVASIAYRKGPYAAEDGDFATAGSARIDYLRRLDEGSLATAELGPHDYRRLLLAGSTALGQGGQLLAALELSRNDGPWEQAERLRKRNAVLRWSSGTAGQGLAISLLSYRADWTATDQVPERAVLSGELGRFGALSPSDGGRTRRDSLSLEWAQRGEAGESRRATAYLTSYGLNLYANPSGFVGRPEGDQQEQEDRRLSWGGQWRQDWTLGAHRLGAGAQWREERISNVGLYSTVLRERDGVVKQDRVDERQLGLFAELQSQWLPGLRSSLALRWDRVQGRVTPLAGEHNGANGGTAADQQLSPKLGLVLGPLAWAGRSEFYLNWGRGFHSNDLRGATGRHNPADGSPLQPVAVLARADSAELGWRATPLSNWHSSLTLWQMDLGSELIYVGDSGVTEPRGASRRLGLEWANDLALGGPWRLDADIAWSRARFRAASEAGQHVPNAIPLTASAALLMDEQGPWSGGLRLRYLGAYALEESGAQRSRAFWTANLQLGWRPLHWLQVRLDVLNLFDRQANDIEYWGASCSRREGPACGGEAGSGLDGRLIHPLEPRSLRLGLRASF